MSLTGTMLADIAHLGYRVVALESVLMLTVVAACMHSVVYTLYRYYTREQGMADTGRGGNVPVFFVDSKRGKDVHMVCVTFNTMYNAAYIVPVWLLNELLCSRFAAIFVNDCCAVMTRTTIQPVASDRLQATVQLVAISTAVEREVCAL
jgi:hypothetical protein